MSDEVDKLREQVARLEHEREELQAKHERLHTQLLHPQRIEVAGTLAAGLAHDMNNVLAAIMNIAELLLDDCSDTRTRLDLEQIVAEAERGAALTKSLLGFARKGQYRRQVLEIDLVVRDVLALLSHTLPKSVEVKLEPGAPGERVDGDPAQLAQILVNLALNAADAMSGKGRLTIASEVTEVDDATAARLGLAGGRHARIFVRDTGCGMDAATQQRMFEPFFTTKPVGKGTGLGLSLVWGVVKAHGGAIDVDSAVGRGTDFAIYLPVTTAPLAARSSPPEPRLPPLRATILVVDDEPHIRQSTTRILERVGYTVLGACDGADALRVFAANQPAIGLVIMDMAMPVMSGAECIRSLREISNVPVLVATGYAIDEEVQTVVARGASLIEKPFSASTLLVEVARLLERRIRA
jgi:two-component system cell cycle sensor histidine kinase/response regulator CckA